MNGVVLTDRIRVKFHGDRGGDGPVTLGQHNTIQWTGKLLTDHFLAMEDWVFQVPERAGVDDVAAAWGVLVSRHESLRTTYPPGCGPDGWPLQRVADSGEITIGVYEADAAVDGAVTARALISALRSQPFDRDRELPVRVAVAVAGSGIRAIVAVYSHMAADFAAMAVIARQFAELAADPASRVVAPRGHQPLDQAEAERSARGRGRAQAALRYWESRMRRGPQSMFALPGPDPGQEPGGGGPAAVCGLVSPAAAKALPNITRRTGASPAMVTLAAVTAVLTHRTASPSCMLASLSSNRVEVRMRDYVGTVSQYCLMLIDAGGTSFDGLVLRVGTESMRAQTHSIYNADELEAVGRRVDDSRGLAVEQDFVVNNLSVFGVNPRDWELTGRGGQGRADAAPGPPPAAGEGELSWWEPPWVPPALVQFNLLATGPVAELALVCADTQRVPRAELALLLRGTERLLAAAATDDPDLGQLAGITGLEPVARGSGWLHIDSCWVSLPASQRLATEALPGAAPRVFAVPGPDGAPVLTAYLVATQAVRTPEQAHAACVRALPGRPAAMAPGRYVLCASMPANPLELAAWQRERALSDGDGRADGHGVHELSARA